LEQLIKIIIAEEKDLNRKALTALLSSYHTLEVIGEAKNDKNLFHLLKIVETDLILLDLELPPTGGKEILKVLFQRFPKKKVIILGTGFDPLLVNELIGLGARSYLSRSRGPDELVSTLLEVHKKGFYFEEKTSNFLLRNLSGQLNDSKNKQKLTKREIEVIKEYINGNSELEIAKNLNISVNTVHFHRMNVYSKSNTHNLPSLLKYLRENSII
jgi:DNA-binding NarL/FixJ family response regulator